MPTKQGKTVRRQQNVLGPHFLSSHVTKKILLKATVAIKRTSGRPRTLSETSQNPCLRKEDLQEGLGNSGVVVCCSTLQPHHRKYECRGRDRRDPLLHPHQNIQHQKSNCCFILKNETWISHLSFSTPHTKICLLFAPRVRCFGTFCSCFSSIFCGRVILWLLVLILCVSCIPCVFLRALKLHQYLSSKVFFANKGYFFI